MHGLAVTGGAISTTGIAGLTLGGGLGWLMGIHGLAADNLLAVELVNAAGEVLNVTAESDPDLFWALRGGGGNFGVAVSFEYRLHPLRDRRWTDRAPVREGEGRPALLPRVHAVGARRADVFAGVVHAPDNPDVKLAAIVPCHAGAPSRRNRISRRCASSASRSWWTWGRCRIPS